MADAQSSAIQRHRSAPLPHAVMALKQTADAPVEHAQAIAKDRCLRPWELEVSLEGRRSSAERTVALPHESGAFCLFETRQVACKDGDARRDEIGSLNGCEIWERFPLGVALGCGWTFRQWERTVPLLHAEVDATNAGLHGVDNCRGSSEVGAGGESDWAHWRTPVCPL